MKRNKTIAVFCGSSTNVDSKYLSSAEKVGQAIALKGFDVVYGGSRNGLMGAVANAALKEKGRVVGVMPRFLVNKEVAHTGLSELYITDTMHERQMGIAERADAFLMLPGGLGTLAEFFEVLTWLQLGLHDAPIAILNNDHYWDGLEDFIKYVKKERFIHVTERPLFTILNKFEDLHLFLSSI